jgi:hypothetical protein
MALCLDALFFPSLNPYDGSYDLSFNHLSFSTPSRFAFILFDNSSVTLYSICSLCIPLRSARLYSDVK